MRGCTAPNGTVGAMTALLEKYKIFIARPDIPQAALEFLSGHEVDVWEKRENIPKDVFLNKIAGKDGLLIGPSNIMDSEAFAAAGNNLKVISTLSAGVDHIDVTEAKKRGVKVGYTAGIVTDAVADVALGLTLMITRRLPEANHTIVSGKWKSFTDMNWMVGHGIKNSTVGIFGLGRIGTEVGKRLLPFKPANIVYTSRTPKKSAADLNAVKVPLEELLKTSDIVIVCVSLNLETKNILNADRLNLMKSTAFLVNISRGAVVDQRALVKILKEKKIAGAAMDVMTPEPLPKGHELLKLENCYLTPHIGSAEASTRQLMAEISIKNILAGLTGVPLPVEVLMN